MRPGRARLRWRRLASWLLLLSERNGVRIVCEQLEGCLQAGDRFADCGSQLDAKE